MSMTLGAAERAREQLQETLLRQREPIIRIGLLTGFLLKTRADLTPADQWSLFVRPLVSQLASLSTPSLFSHLPPGILETLNDAMAIRSDDSLKQVSEDIRQAILVQAFYVGDWERYCALLGISPSAPEANSDPLVSAESLLPVISPGADRDFLEQHIRRWKHLVSQRSPAEIQVLMVTPDQMDLPAHGVLTTLELIHLSGAAIPHLRFDHTGEHVDAAVLALDAARSAASRWLLRELHLPAPSGAELRLRDVKATIEGPSLALAIAGLCVSDTTKWALARRQFRFPGNVAVTGSLDAEGRVQPVLGISEKVTRAFFSHVDYVAIPAEQEQEAQQIADELSATHPRRTLSIVPVRHLDDLFSQRRLVADYLVPLPLHGVRQLNRMPRWSQALVLLVLTAALVFKFFPLTRPWLDRTPVFWDARNGQELVVKNRDLVVLWSFDPGIKWDAISPELTMTNERLTELAVDTLDNLREPTSTNLKYVNSCFISDVTGDKLPEILFIVLDKWADRNQQTRFHVFCLGQAGSLLWRRSFDKRDVSQLIAGQSMPTKVVCWMPIDWLGNGKANIIVSQADGSFAGRSWAFLEEIDGRTGITIREFWHFQWFWALLALPNADGKGATLWAGTLNQSGHPELFVFRDSLRARVWLCADTAGFAAVRFPIADIFLAKEKGAWLWAISEEGKGGNVIELTITNTEIAGLDGYAWHGYRFQVDRRFRWVGELISNNEWGKVLEFVHQGIIPRPPSCRAWCEPLTYGEVWTGEKWVPVDTSRPPPDPYPIYSL